MRKTRKTVLYWFVAVLCLLPAWAFGQDSISWNVNLVMGPSKNLIGRIAIAQSIGGFVEVAAANRVEFDYDKLVASTLGNGVILTVPTVGADDLSPETHEPGMASDPEGHNVDERDPSEIHMQRLISKRLQSMLLPIPDDGLNSSLHFQQLSDSENVLTEI